MADGPPDALIDRWLIAGPLKAGQKRQAKGFNAYTLWRSPFNATSVMAWSRRVYTSLTVYVSATLPCEAGLRQWSGYANEISKWVKDCYGSEERNWTMDRIEAMPFAREEMRRVLERKSDTGDGATPVVQRSPRWSAADPATLGELAETRKRTGSGCLGPRHDTARRHDRA